jgi:hypothetical protein
MTDPVDKGPMTNTNVLNCFKFASPHLPLSPVGRGGGEGAIGPNVKIISALVLIFALQSIFSTWSLFLKKP